MNTRVDLIIMFILILILISAFIPSLIASFVDVHTPDSSSAVYGVSSFFKGAFWFVSLAPPFSLIPSVLANYYYDAWNSFTYLPDYVSIPLLLFMVFDLAALIIFVGGS